MNKRIHLFVMAVMATICAAAAPNIVKAPAKAPASRAASVVEMTKMVSAIYDDGYETPDYYLILSDSDAASYNYNTGDFSVPDGHYSLILDLYNHVTNPVALPTGTYRMRDAVNGYGAYTFESEYSMLNYHSDGAYMSIHIEENVVVEEVDGVYTITTSVVNPNDPTQMVNIRFEGRLPMTDVHTKPTVYPQIMEDINAELNYGGISFYQGVTDYTRNGVSTLNVYSCPIDEQGVMQADGYNLCMMVAHKRFVKKEAYEVVPGTYEGATNLERFTWYPCREIDYTFGGSVITLPFGSYIRKRTNGEYTYAYLKDGTFTINDNGDGTFSGTLDATTSMGYKVTLTWQGKIALNTDNATFKATVSNLTDDVDLDFSKLKTGRVFHTGLKGGCRCFVLDLGSPSGRDEEIIYGGDLMRFEFLLPQTADAVQSGIYNVVLDRWNDNELKAGGTYEPFSLNKGYFANGGDPTGTRYCHFEDGRYMVYDFHAPVEEGSVKVSTTDFKTYHMEIALMDDAAFEIRGTWDGPIEYMYDRDALAKEIEAGIHEVSADDVNVYVADGKIITDGPAHVYDLTGHLVATGSGAIALPSGLYIVNVANKSIKVVL